MHYDVAYKVFQFIGRDRCQRDRIRQKAVSLLVRNLDIEYRMMMVAFNANMREKQWDEKPMTSNDFVYYSQ
jgi:hypothetical protein